MKRKSQKPLTLLVVTAVILLLMTIFRSSPLIQSLRSVGTTVTEPIVRPFYTAGITIRSFFSRPTNIAELQRENESLRDEVTLLKSQLSQLQTADQENQSLRQLLNFFEDSTTNLPKTAARVIGKDPQNPSILLLNVGLRDGIEQHNAVVVEEGIMIAKIIDVNARSSRALLLTDTQSQVAATVSGGAPTSKMASGARGLSLLLDQIPQGETITQGQLVITSGLEPTIPKGLIIGEVEEVISEQNDLFQRAILRPLADAGTHTFVSVILSASNEL